MADFSRREEFERRLARALGRTQQEIQRLVMETLGNPPDLNNLSPAFWEDIAGRLQGIMQPLLEGAFMAHALDLVGAQTVGIDVAIVNQRAAAWARQYSFDLVRGITDKTRASLQESIVGFFTDQRTLGDLEASIAPLFGPVRAEMIAITETTRAATAGEMMFAEELQKMGLATTQIWQTNNDDLVCPICGPLNQTRQGSGWTLPPPAHPRCRCWISTEVATA